MTDDKYAIAVIVASFGVAGWCSLSLLTESAERLRKLDDVEVGPAEGPSRLLKVEKVKVSGRRPQIKFAEIGDRTSADRLRGLYLFVEKKDLAVPRTGRYYIHDLVGADVVDQHGAVIGTIVDVYKHAAPDYWVVRTARGDALIPAVKEFVKSVDIKGRKVVLEVIEGLLDV